MFKKESLWWLFKKNQKNALNSNPLEKLQKIPTEKVISVKSKEILLCAKVLGPLTFFENTYLFNGLEISIIYYFVPLMKLCEMF
jgi:hypothetical protein